MIRLIVASIISLSLIIPGFAAEPAKAQGHTFLGIKGGFMKPDGKNTDSAGNIGAVMGQPIARYFSWEAEFSLTAFEGEAFGSNNWDINTLAGYGVFRSEGNIGFKGKAGLLYWDSTYNDDLDLSLGIGVGFKMGQSGMLDVEFTRINSNVDYISVGYLFNF